MIDLPTFADARLAKLLHHPVPSFGGPFDTIRPNARQLVKMAKATCAERRAEIRASRIVGDAPQQQAVALGDASAAKLLKRLGEGKGA